MDEVLRYLEDSDGPVGYVLLGLCAAFEYVFPPFPGDTVVLFGAFLAATADYRPLAVYLALTTGSLLGGLGAYAFGRRFDDEARWPRWLRTKRARWAFGVLRSRFDRYGALYLALNRFLPAMRAFFFVAAGLARMPVGRVLLFGGLSAAVWNALLLAAGYYVGRNWGRLVELSQRYTVVSLLVVLALVSLWIGRAWWSRRRRRSI